MNSHQTKSKSRKKKKLTLVALHEIFGNFGRTSCLWSAEVTFKSCSVTNITAKLMTPLLAFYAPSVHHSHPVYRSWTIQPISIIITFVILKYTSLFINCYFYCTSHSFFTPILSRSFTFVTMNHSKNIFHVKLIQKHITG